MSDIQPNPYVDDSPQDDDTPPELDGDDAA